MPMTPVPVLFSPLTFDAQIPSYAKPGDAGMDVYARQECVLPPGTWGLFGLGFRVAVPDGYELQIRPKSGLALMCGLSILNTPGTVDSGYRGEVKALVVNHGTNPVTIQAGQKIAQVVLCPVAQIAWHVVESLPETERSRGGFGSTGIFRDESHAL